MIEEAQLRPAASGMRADSEGWYVIHVSEAHWKASPQFGAICVFEGTAGFRDFGVNIRVLQPGQPASYYHTDSGQEAFFVLSGECTLVVEGQERSLHAGHFVHCPAGTEHAFVGSGEEPCAILMMGARSEDKRIHYPVNATAASHAASVAAQTDDPKVAYRDTAPYDPISPARFAHLAG